MINTFGENVSSKKQIHGRIFFQYLFQLMDLFHFFICVALVWVTGTRGCCAALF